jgi:hypothetical protein
MLIPIAPTYAMLIAIAATYTYAWRATYTYAERDA